MKFKKLMNYIDSEKNEIISFVKELIKTSSINPPGNEQDVGRIIREKAKNLNLGQGEVIAKKADRPNIVFTLKGDNYGNSLFLNGHMDTKPPGDLDKWKYSPFEPKIINGKLYGLGSSDMKGALGAMIFALAALKKFNIVKRGNLKLILTSDEEAETDFGASYLCNNYDFKSDIGLVGEPAGIVDSWQSIYIANRKLLGFKILIKGTQMHSSLSDQISCINANEKMCNVINKMNENLNFDLEFNDKFSLGITKNIGLFLKGGVNYGVNPGEAEFKSELRVPPSINRDILFNKIQNFVQEIVKQDPDLCIKIEKEIPNSQENLNNVKINEDGIFVSKLKDTCNEILGYVPSIDLFPGGTDASIFQEIKKIPTISAFGPGILSVCHKPNEFVFVSDIILATKIYALIAAKYLST